MTEQEKLISKIFDKSVEALGIMTKSLCEAIKSNNDIIQASFEDWKIERVDRYYYASGRNYNTYIETTYWYESHSMQRKETIRQETISCGNTHSLPEWAKGITEHRKSLSYF